MNKKKGKRKALERTADLDTTMNDDIRPRQLQHHLKDDTKADKKETVIAFRPSNRGMDDDSDEDDGIEGLTPTTLKNDFNLRDKVRLPENVPLEQWIYTSLMDFVEITSMLYDSVADMCTSETCPEMSAGSHYSYFWTDFNGSNPVPMTAKQYITTLFHSISNQFKTPPYDQCASGTFPDSFMQLSRAICKKLFRVYAHVYHHHLNEFTKMDAEAHLNTTFKHFMLFVHEFKMINVKEELPLRKLIQQLLEGEEEENRPEDPRLLMSRGINSVSYRRILPQTEFSDN